MSTETGAGTPTLREQIAQIIRQSRFVDEHAYGMADRILVALRGSPAPQGERERLLEDFYRLTLEVRAAQEDVCTSEMAYRQGGNDKYGAMLEAHGDLSQAEHRLATVSRALTTPQEEPHG